MEAMLAQEYGEETVPVEDGLRELLDRVGARSPPEERSWWVGGSASLWLRGLGPPPHDLDLGVTLPGAAALAEALAEYLIEPSGPTLDAEGRSRFGARSFLGTHRRGVRIEWAVADGRSPPEFAERVARQLQQLSWEGRSVLVPPIELSAIRAAGAFDAPAWDEFLSKLATVRLDLAVLEQGLDGSAVPPGRAGQLRELAGPAPP
jgi:hypothetical protein